MNVDGHVIVEKDIPRNLTDYTFSVGVRDQQMESDGDEPISVTVRVAVQRKSTYIPVHMSPYNVREHA